jgi:hypothetical protein
MENKVDAKEQAKREAKEAKEKAKKDAIEAKEKAKREAIEAERAKIAEAKAKKEAEIAAKEQAKKDAIEAEEKAKREAIEAKEKAKREAEEAKRAEKAEVKAKKEDKGKTVKRIFQNNFRLILKMPVNSNQSKQFVDLLKQSQDLRIVWVGGSVEEGVVISVSMLKPIAVNDILAEIPMIDKYDVNGADIVVTLKSSV